MHKRRNLGGVTDLKEGVNLCGLTISDPSPMLPHLPTFPLEEYTASTHTHLPTITDFFNPDPPPAQRNTQNGIASSKRRTSFETRFTTCPLLTCAMAALLSRSTLPCTAATACCLMRKPMRMPT